MAVVTPSKRQSKLLTSRDREIDRPTGKNERQSCFVMGGMEGPEAKVVTGAQFL